MINLNKFSRGVSKKSGDASPVIARLDRPASRGFANVLKGEGSGMTDPAVQAFAGSSAFATRMRGFKFQ